MDPRITQRNDPIPLQFLQTEVLSGDLESLAPKEPLAIPPARDAVTIQNSFDRERVIGVDQKCQLLVRCREIRNVGCADVQDNVAESGICLETIVVDETTLNILYEDLVEQVVVG